MILYRALTAAAVGLILLIDLEPACAGDQEKVQIPSESQVIETSHLQSGTQASEAIHLKSGLQVGETIASFEVDDVTGPAKGKSICYACDYGTRPVINVFIRNVTPENTILIQKLDQLVAKHVDDDLKVFVVLLSMDPDADRKQLIELEQQCDLAYVPLTIFDGITGPKNCKIHQHAAETVVMWNKAKVKSNRAFAAGQLNDKAIAAILDDVPKILE
jgi:hypothetical protein